MTDTLNHAIERSRVFSDIRSCTKCPLHENCRQPVPFKGKSPNRVMVLGEAPGSTEDKYNKLAIGPSGKELEQIFKDAGLVLGDLFIANAVCCYPHAAPEKDALHACNGNLRAQLSLCDPQWVITLGKVALSTTGVRGTISDLHGRPFYMPYGPFIDRYIMPTYHPAAALRDPGKIAIIMDDLVTMRKLLTEVTQFATVRVIVGRNGKVM